MQVTIKGKASGKTQVTSYDSSIKVTLLEFLQDHKIPIASSCQGRGKCRKCSLSDYRLACEIECFKENKDIIVEFDYL